MKAVVRVIVLVLLMSTLAFEHGHAADDEFYKTRVIENMKLASTWIIENGVNVFSEDGKPGIHRKLVDEWGVQIWVDPWVETERFLAQFRIKARGINYDIHNLYREKSGEQYYEFWLVKVAATEWSGETARSVFFVAQTEDIFGKREILVQSDQFIEEYRAGSKSIALPISDLRLLYDMQPWLFPDAYKGSDLEGVHVVMDANGQIRLKK